MAYSADTFVADEQPTTAKWNKLWSNDASFNDGTGIANNAITSSHISGISKSNLTTDSNPYKFAAYRNAAVNTATSFTKIGFDTEDFDTNSNYDNATNFRYTAPVAGFYSFNWLVGVPIAGAGADSVASMYKNGTTYQWGNELAAGGGVQGSALISLAASDYIEIFSVCATGGVAINVGGSPRKTKFDGIMHCRT